MMSEQEGPVTAPRFKRKKPYSKRIQTSIGSSHNDAHAEELMKRFALTTTSPDHFEIPITPRPVKNALNDTATDLLAYTSYKSRGVHLTPLASVTIAMPYLLF